MEWLKDELTQHLAALKRSKLIDVWHDRLIPPGGILNDEIDRHLYDSDLFLFLVSSDFLSSNYCMEREYAEAVKRQSKGEAIIIPILIRHCDWATDGLKRYKALPNDADPVTANGNSKHEPQARDSKWLEVAQGIRFAIDEFQKTNIAPTLKQSYIDNLFLVDSIRHPLMPQFDERLILIDPNIYYEGTKEQVSTFARLKEIVHSERACIIVGDDMSGKSVVAKSLHAIYTSPDYPTVLLSGKLIKNKEIYRLVDAAIKEQYGDSNFAKTRYGIIIDDFDECTLPDNIKESIIEAIFARYRFCVLTSFSNAPAVLFTSNGLPTPAIFQLNDLTDSKVLQIVNKWTSIGKADDDHKPLEIKSLSDYERVQMAFSQTGLTKTPNATVTFLQLSNTISGSDISFSSYAACYDILINTRLRDFGVDVRAFDEVRNFLSLLAYGAYSETGTHRFTRGVFEKCIQKFFDDYLSSPELLRKASVGLFISSDGEGYFFKEEYLWYFLSAFYVVKTLKFADQQEYKIFVKNCTDNIFQRKFANIIIYMAYFSSDSFVLEMLLETLDKIFSKANDWLISDDTRELMIGLDNKDALSIEASSDVSENRLKLLQSKLSDLISDADKVVAQYTLPFLHVQIGDASNEDVVDVSLDHESYMKSVNALMRTHSVIGQILGSRSGTFAAELIIDCITRMVQASGRYVALNHAIAAVLVFDRDMAVRELGRVFKSDQLTDDERYEKVTRIYAFWSVYISHAGLARYLSQQHSIRALEILAERMEGDASKTEGGNTPFNFTLVKLIAKLYSSGRIDRDELEAIEKVYGKNSALMSMLRVVFHMYSYYLPFSIEDKQWLSGKLRMPLRKLEIQHLRAVTARGGRSKAG